MATEPLSCPIGSPHEFRLQMEFGTQTRAQAFYRNQVLDLLNPEMMVFIAQQRLDSAIDGAREEIDRTRGGEGLPIEALNSVSLLSEAGRALVEAVGGYNLAQFQLFVAIGQTPRGAVPASR